MANENLLENNLFLSLLSGAGASLNPQGISPGLDKLVQQNIGAQSQHKYNKSMMKMLAAMMRGDIPEGGSIQVKPDGTTFKAPGNLLKDSEEGLDLAQEGSMLPGGSGKAWTKENIPSAFNPFR